MDSIDPPRRRGWWPSGRVTADGRIRRIAALATGAAVLLSIGAVLGSRWVKSPGQVAAEAAGPPPSSITAPVEHRVLRRTVVLRGEAGAAGHYDLTPSVQGAVRPVVTAVRVAVGADIRPRQVLLEVAGRPLVALPGRLPAFRDLRPGSSGNDVSQLQAALRGASQRIGDPDGVFGAATKRAVERFYRDLGYEPAITADPSREQVDAARAAAQQAGWAVADAEEALRLARQSTAGKADQVRAAQRALSRAKQQRTTARATATDLELRYGPMVPLAEYLFLPTFPARVDKLTATVGADVQTPLISLSSGELSVKANLSPSQRALLAPGMKVEISSEVLGLTFAGKISRIGELTEDSTGTRSFPMSVVPSEGAFDRKIVGQDLRLTVEAARSAGAVLVVPISAVYSGADGRTSVLRRRGDGATERVFVAAGASGDGFVEIRVTEGRLRAGDAVVVGE